MKFLFVIKVSLQQIQQILPRVEFEKFFFICFSLVQLQISDSQVLILPQNKRYLLCN